MDASGAVNLNQESAQIIVVCPPRDARAGWTDGSPEILGGRQNIVSGPTN